MNHGAIVSRGLTLSEVLGNHGGARERTVRLVRRSTPEKRRGRGSRKKKKNPRISAYHRSHCEHCFSMRRINDDENSVTFSQRDKRYSIYSRFVESGCTDALCLLPLTGSHMFTRSRGGGGFVFFFFFLREAKNATAMRDL